MNPRRRAAAAAKGMARGKVNRGRRLLALAALAGAAVAISSCGLKTAPLTPDSPRPAAVQDLKGEARGDVALLSWSLPRRNIEGKEMAQPWISAFRVFRAEVDPVRPGKRLRYREVALITVSEGIAAAERGRAVLHNGRMLWSDPDLRYDRQYAYRVRAVSVRGGESPVSDEVRVAPLLALAAPGGVGADAGDSVVVLTWSEVTTRADGSAPGGFVGYNVYRRTDKSQYGDMPLNTEPLRTASYRDAAVSNNTTYYYVVRSVDSPARPWRESLDSAEVSATPRDRTPPAPPAGLTVVPGVGRIFLTWNENREPDLAGYHVYRSRQSGAGYGRLTDKPLSRTTFSDESPEPGVTYYYVITAVDRAGNESGRSRQGSAAAERLR